MVVVGVLVVVAIVSVAVAAVVVVAVVVVAVHSSSRTQPRGGRRPNIPQVDRTRARSREGPRHKYTGPKPKVRTVQHHPL